jgi:hypothetical protein
VKRGGFGARAVGPGTWARAARAELAPAYPEPQRKILTRNHGEAARVLRGLSTLWTPAEGWILVPQVRSHLGAAGDDLRVADVIAVETIGAQRRIYVEIKISRADMLEDTPEKSAEIASCCHARVFAVPRGEYRRIFLRDSDIPEGWGVVVVDGGEAELVARPLEVDAAEPPAGLWLSMLRSASTASEREAGPDLGGVPMVAITRPHLPHGNSGTVCGHVVPRPMSKGLRWPEAPCASCALELPPDFEVFRAMLAEASPDERRRYRAQMDAIEHGGGR